jgi:hypothetical protein
MSNYGVFVNGRRPKSKKAIKEAIADGTSVRFENTSMHGGDDVIVRDGVILDGTLPRGMTIVGPCPYTDRKFYGQVAIGRDGKVVVK